MDRILTSIAESIDLNKISNDRGSIIDDELVAIKSSLPSIQKRLDNFSDKYSELLSMVSETDKEMTDKYTENYTKLLQHYDRFKDKLNKEVKSRELDKEKKFKSASLNINLPEFKGYEFELDIYTFKDKFEKLHSSTTPKRLMPEFLKNNLLEGPALEFVKRLECIDEITLMKEHVMTNLKMRTFGRH